MTEMTKRMILFSGSVNPELAEEIAKYLNVNLGNIKHEKFANGEIYARYQESIRGADVFLIQSVCASETFDVNDALMELLIMADAAKRASARSISAVIAHYGYARQDRKAAPREPITAKLVADLLEVSGIDNIITVDLHQDAIQGFFDIPVNHMTAMPIFVDYFRNKGFDPERLCVVSPDVGRAKAAKKFSTALDCDIAIMHKDRPKHNQAEITALIGDVTDKICILNDDMIDTGGIPCGRGGHAEGQGRRRGVRLRYPRPVLRPGLRAFGELLHRGSGGHQRRARAAGAPDRQDQGALHRAAVRADHRCRVQQRLYWEIVRIAAWLSGPSPRGGSPRSNSIEARIASRASGSPFLHFNELRAGPLPGDSGLLFQR